MSRSYEVFGEMVKDDSQSKEKKIATIKKGLENLEFKLKDTKRPDLKFISANVWSKRFKNPVFVKETEHTISFIRPHDPVDCSYIISFKGKSPKLYKRNHRRQGHINTIRHSSVKGFDYLNHCNIFVNSFKDHNSNLIQPKLDKFLIELVNKRANLDGKFKNFHEYLYKLIYKGSNILPIEQIPPIFVPFLRHEDNLDILIKKFFGYNSKSIKKTFLGQFENKNIRPSGLVLAHSFKKKTSVDFIRQFMECGAALPTEYRENKEQFKLFKKFSNCFVGRERRLLKLLNEDSQNTGYYFSDALKNLKVLLDDNSRYDLFQHDFKNTTELHNNLSRDARKIKDKPFDLNQKDLEEIDGAEIDNIRIIVPKQNHCLIDAANELSNCLAGYAESVKSGRTKILLIYIENILTYAVQISEKQIRQFYGKYNSHPDPTHKELVTKFLEENKIVISQDKKDCIDGALLAANW